MATKKNLFVILVIDLIIILGSIYLLNNRYQQFKQQTYSKKEDSHVSFQPVIISTQTDTKSFEEKISIEEKISHIKTQQKRNILFQYRTSIANNVAIIGDFNEWIPEFLIRDKNHVWKITFKLDAGKYLYNYLVDGKVILDPNNRNTPINNEIRGFRSSVLYIKQKK